MVCKTYSFLNLNGETEADMNSKLNVKILSKKISLKTCMKKTLVFELFNDWQNKTALHLLKKNNKTSYHCAFCKTAFLSSQTIALYVFHHTFRQAMFLTILFLDLYRLKKSFQMLSWQTKHAKCSPLKPKISR